MSQHSRPPFSSSPGSARLRGLWLCGLIGLWLLSSMACQQAGWWETPEDQSTCDPGQQTHLTSHSLWIKTFGSSAGTAKGCLRISWGTNDSQGRSVLVEVSKDGDIRAFDAQTNAFTAPVSVALPSDAQTLPRRFRLFVFGDAAQTDEGQQKSVCAEKMASPIYSCRADQECWFALAFRPKPPEGQQPSPPISGAGGASCAFFPTPKPPVEPSETAPETPADTSGESTQESISPDAAGGDEPSMETAQETPPENECTPGEQEPCYPAGQNGCEVGKNCVGLCKRGNKTCAAGGFWGPCQGSVTPKDETCDGLDNNCDGQVDEGLSGCNPGCVSQCVTTLAGTGSPGSQDGKGTSASFNEPQSIAFASGASIVIADAASHRIRRYTIATGAVSLIAGNTAGYQNGVGAQARFSRPTGVAVDGAGNIYVADTENHVIRKIDTQGRVTLVAGQVGKAGFQDGAAGATFNFPRRVAIEPNGALLYVADTSNHAIRVVDLAQKTVTTLAGSGSPGHTDATGKSAIFDEPLGMTFDSSGNVYVADSANNMIRKITPTGIATTVAGTGLAGHKDGDALIDALFNKPADVAIDGNKLYIADTFNLRIRILDLTSDKVSTYAGQRTAGDKDGPLGTATFNYPRGIALDPQQKWLFVIDTDNHSLRAIKP